MTSADQITPDWLTQILQRSGYLNQGTVISVATQSNPSNSTDGPGFHNRNRIEIHYSSDAMPSAPSRLYLKAHDGALHKAAGAREVAFYLSTATQMPAPPAPICFDAAYDSESIGPILGLGFRREALGLSPLASVRKGDAGVSGFEM